jgi:formylglycine-generating enzyme required for sulfatase activity
VWEWVLDWEGPYPREHEEDPTGPARGLFHVLRGGSWAFGAKSCRASVRNWFEESRADAPTPSELRGDPAEPNDDIGFRPVLALRTD